MKLAIVILNWNGLELLKRYLPIVVQHSLGSEIYVADNASTDGSIAWINDHFPLVHTLSIPENLGYAGGYNYVVPNIEAEVICLLNNDVAATNGWCEPFINSFQKFPNLGAAQPKILDDLNNDMFEYAGAAGGFLDQLGYPYCRGRIFEHVEMDHGQYDFRIDTDWASGAALFIRKSAFLKVGGFDVDYFAHQEEIDLCWRLRQQGYTIQVLPESHVYHLGGGTLNSISPRKTFLNFRNSLFSMVKNDCRWYWWILIFFRLQLDGLAALKFLFNGKPKHFIAVLKAHFSFYGLLPKMLKKRSSIQKENQVHSINLGIKSIVGAYYILEKRRFSD